MDREPFSHWQGIDYHQLIIIEHAMHTLVVLWHFGPYFGLFWHPKKKGPRRSKIVFIRKDSAHQWQTKNVPSRMVRWFLSAPWTFSLFWPFLTMFEHVISPSRKTAMRFKHIFWEKKLLINKNLTSVVRSFLDTLWKFLGFFDGKPIDASTDEQRPL